MVESAISGGAVTARAAAEASRLDALAHLEHGAFADALACYDAALASARETADPAFVDWIYVCRAAAAAETGPAADELVELKRILLRSREPQTAFRAAYSSAAIYRLRKERSKVFFYANLARRHAEEIGDPRLIGACFNEVGNALAADSRFGEAAAAYRSALERTAAEAGLLAVPRAQWSDNLGYCLIAEDRVAEGLALVHAALDTLEKEAARGFTVYPLLDLCFGYLKQDRYAEARWFGDEGLSRVAVAAVGDLEAEKNLLYLLGEASHLSGDAAASQDYFDRLARLYPDFRNLRAYLDVFDFRNVINLRS
jgi:tetratricopeptide (TPR) repeat protein